MSEYIKLIVGVTSGLFFTYLFSRSVEYVVNRYFASIDERFAKNDAQHEARDARDREEHEKIYNRLNEHGEKLAAIETRCDERDKKE